MKAVTFLVIAASLPILGRFQETTVFQHGQVVFRQAFYSQTLVAALMLVAASVLFLMVWRSRLRGQEPRKHKLVHFAPALFALPAGWQQWTVSQFGDANAYTEIRVGLGGPLTVFALIAAAVLFVAVDVYWRHTKEA